MSQLWCDKLDNTRIPFLTQATYIAKTFFVIFFAKILINSKLIDFA